MTGLQVCYKIREKSTVPILILSALNTSENIALGLDSGQDDYLLKPFKFIELHARIRSLLRRIDYSVQSSESTYVFEDLIIDDIQKTAIRNGK